MLNTGIIAKAKEIGDRLRFGEIVYHPTKMTLPSRLITSKSQAWVGLEKIVLDIIEFSKIKQESALEFGVEFGYSIAVLANYFKSVKGIDIFTGDEHAGFHGDIYNLAKNNLKDFDNIELIRSDYKDYISANDLKVDMIHIDIIHTYEDTYSCGLWGAEHSNCTIFHDTQSFPEVKKAVADIAKRTKKKFFNYRKHNGLGILI